MRFLFNKATPILLFSASRFICNANGSPISVNPIDLANESPYANQGIVPVEDIGSFVAHIHNAIDKPKNKVRGMQKLLIDKKRKLSKKSCDPKNVMLEVFPQWQAEKGYWIGDYSLYGSEGDPFKSNSWNYRYDNYKGFITGNIEGNTYIQRNVFAYPPQKEDVCKLNDEVFGGGICGIHGNTKLFDAMQEAITCTPDPEVGGDIEGAFGDLFYTTTELVGRDNAVLYQVWLVKENPPFFLEEDRLWQSQLTTITKTKDGVIRRTRTAQSFADFVNPGVPTSVSFYRESKVEKSIFYQKLQNTLSTFNILESDTCTHMNDFNTGGLTDTGHEGFAGCMDHLEESFDFMSFNYN